MMTPSSKMMPTSTTPTSAPSTPTLEQKYHRLEVAHTELKEQCHCLEVKAVMLEEVVTAAGDGSTNNADQRLLDEVHEKANAIQQLRQEQKRLQERLQKAESKRKEEKRMNQNLKLSLQALAKEFKDLKSANDTQKRDATNLKQQHQQEMQLLQSRLKELDLVRRNLAKKCIALEGQSNRQKAAASAAAKLMHEKALAMPNGSSVAQQPTKPVALGIQQQKHFQQLQRQHENSSSFNHPQPHRHVSSVPRSSQSDQNAIAHTDPSSFPSLYKYSNTATTAKSDDDCDDFDDDDFEAALNENLLLLSDDTGAVNFALRSRDTAISG